MADPWEERFFSLPVGASRRDPVVGFDELGREVYMAPTGQRYWFNEGTQPRGSVVRGALDAVTSQSPWETGGQVLNALAGGIWDAVSAPANALRGEPVTYGDVWNTAGMAQLGAAAMPAPRGALRSGSMRSLDVADAVTPEQSMADDIMRLLREGRAAEVTDEMMAAADQAYLSSIYDLPLDEASRMQRAKGMFLDAAERARDEEFASVYGLRTDNTWDGIVRPSRVWNEGELTDEILPGTSVTDLRAMRGKEDVAFAMHGVNPDGVKIPWNANNYVTGLDGDRKFLSLIYGDVGSVGEDAYESVIRDGISMLTRNRTNARFDPRLAHLRNLSAGLGGLGLGIALTGNSPEADEIRNYLAGI